jgi:endogenous inhibitor of DNA gyrase (YacG/DUF329 family)
MANPGKEASESIVSPFCSCPCEYIELLAGVENDERFALASLPAFSRVSLLVLLVMK